jgi:hypothetical protein
VIFDTNRGRQDGPLAVVTCNASDGKVVWCQESMRPSLGQPMASRRGAGKLAGAAARGIMKPLHKLVKEGEQLVDIARTTARKQDLPSGRPGRGDGGLFSRSGELSNREVLEQNIGLPRTQETVDRYTQLAGVDFRGARVEIVESADDIAYLDFQGAVARTDDLGVQLGPAAFQNEETLVRTLGHESVHVRQYQEGIVSSMTGPLEAEAYGAEDAFVQTWRRNTQ